MTAGTYQEREQLLVSASAQLPVVIPQTFAAGHISLLLTSVESKFLFCDSTGALYKWQSFNPVSRQA